jgi:hypothetical protein
MKMMKILKTIIMFSMGMYPSLKRRKWRMIMIKEMMKMKIKKR